MDDIWCLLRMDVCSSLRITLFLVLLVEKSQMNKNVPLVQFAAPNFLHNFEFDLQVNGISTYLLWAKQRPIHECVPVQLRLRLKQLLVCYLLEIHCMPLGSFHSGSPMYHSNGIKPGNHCLQPDKHQITNKH